MLNLMNFVSNFKNYLSKKEKISSKSVGLKDSAYKKTVVFESIVKYSEADRRALLLIKVDGAPQLVYTSPVQNFDPTRIETENSTYLKSKKNVFRSPVAGLDTAEITVEDFELAKFQFDGNNEATSFTYEGYVDPVSEEGYLGGEGSVPASKPAVKQVGKPKSFDVNATIDEITI